MAYGIIHFFPGGTQQQYEATLAAVHPEDGLPEGQIFHAAGASPGGWTIFAVHESKDSWERFRDSVLAPALQKSIAGGLQGPPEETGIEDVSIRQP